MNILIVESENDEYFVRALIDKMQQGDTDVVRIHEFKYSPAPPNLKSIEKAELTRQIGLALNDITPRTVEKIGIILDMDEKTRKDRLDLVNACLKVAYQEQFDEATSTEITETDKMFDLKIVEDDITVQIACHFTNVDGEGELETVLKAIASKDSVFADCLIEGWQPCIEKKGKKVVEKGQQGDITHKQILKLWVDFYKRFDTLKKGKRNFENTDWSGIWTGEIQPKRGKPKPVTARGKDIFDLDSLKLDDMRKFLALFK